jgi:hypothetical protein
VPSRATFERFEQSPDQYRTRERLLDALAEARSPLAEDGCHDFDQVLIGALISGPARIGAEQVFWNALENPLENRDRAVGSPGHGLSERGVATKTPPVGVVACPSWCDNGAGCTGEHSAEFLCTGGATAGGVRDRTAPGSDVPGRDRAGDQDPSGFPVGLHV